MASCHSTRHSPLRLVAQHGRVPAADPGAPGPLWPASRARTTRDRLAGANRGRLEPDPHALCLERLAATATGTRPLPPAGRLRGCRSTWLLNCRVTHYPLLSCWARYLQEG